MTIKGSFVNAKGDVVGVTITLTATGTDLEIEPDGELEFAADDTVTIDSGVNDSLDVAQQHGCTINLHARSYVGNLFTSEYKDGKVEVTVNGSCVFSGWLEPRVLSMPFNEYYDDLSLQAVDSLSACQYSKYGDVKDSTDYDAAVGKTSLRTFKELLKDGLDHGTSSDGGYSVWWDGSRATADGGNVWDGLSVNDMAFLGDDADDTCTYLDTVEAVLKYLDLHVTQYGGDFYVFSWDTVRQGKATWARLMGDGTAALPSWDGKTVTAALLTNDNVEDMGTTLDVQEVYNQLSLTVSPKGDDTVIQSPLDSDGTVPALGPRTLYMTEFAVDGSAIGSAAHSFWDLVRNRQDTSFKGEGQKVWKDYYVRVMRNVYWKMGHGSGPGSEVTDPVAAAMSGGASSTSQRELVDGLGDTMKAMLLKMGTVDHKPGTGDNSKQATLSMTSYLVIGVNGNGSDTAPYPDDADIQAAMPLMSYEGGSATTVFSPSGEGETNYLVIDGTLTLCPLMGTNFVLDGVRGYSSAEAFRKGYSGDYLDTAGDGILTFGKLLAPSRTDTKAGRYLTFGWDWNGLQNVYGDTLTWSKADWEQWRKTGKMGHWIPYTDDGPEQYEYKTADGKDTVEKVDVLWCMLTIGDKVLVEDKTKTGGVDAFAWKTYKTLADCGNDVDAYLEQTFTIGVDPKIGDKMIGTDFEVGTNFDWQQNISADKGMAIPLPHADKLHGKLRLQVLGVDNGPWADYHKTRHHTMFRHSKWGTDNIPLMSHVSSVVVKDFSVKFYTGDGGDDGGDNDVVYMSRESHKFYNKKDDLEMRIHSGFTAEEVDKYGLSNKMMYTTVCGSDGLAVTAIKNTVTGDTAKAEKLYVDAYYKELSKPRVILTQNLQCKDMAVRPFTLWTHAALGKVMYVRDIGWNLMEGSAQAKLEETF